VATTAIPGGKVQVVGAPRKPRFAPRLVGGLLLIVVLALLGWWILGLVWAVLRLVELVAVGLGCGYLGYRVGVLSGRHKEREARGR
jgi:hypothetical protein